MTPMKPEVAAFLQNKRFNDTPANRQALAKWLSDRSLAHTPEVMAQAFYELAQQGVAVLEWTEAERARQERDAEAAHAFRLKNDPILKAKREAEQRQAAEAAERKHWAERAKPLPGESSLATLQRVTREKEMAARKKLGIPFDPYSYGGKKF